MKKIKFLFRYYFLILIYFFLKKYLQKKNFNKIINIINFHYFVENDKKIIDPSLEINIDIFEKQISILSKEFNIISTKRKLDKFFTRDNKKEDKNSIIITIDDADYNIIKILPIIDKLNVPVLIFAPIGFCLPITDIIGLRSRCLHFSYFKYVNKNLKIDSLILLKIFEKLSALNYLELKKIYNKLINNNDSFFISKKFLSINDLSEIGNNKLITISSHSMSHVPLSFLPNKWVEWEMKESVKYIQKCNGDTSLFSYPYGYKESINSNVKDLLKLNGFDYAFTTRAKVLQKNHDKLELGRTFLFNNSNINYVMATANGLNQIFDKILNR